MEVSKYYNLVYHESLQIGAALSNGYSKHIPLAYQQENCSLSNNKAEFKVSNISSNLCSLNLKSKEPTKLSLDNANKYIYKSSLNNKN